MAAAREKRKTKLKKVSEGIVHINATFNNTMITITDLSGNVVSWSAAGKCGFKGSRKATPHAGQSAAEDALRVALDCGLRSAEVRVKGPGAGREQALRSVHNAGVRVTMIKDVSPLPHNGCRPPKKRRV